MSQFDSISKLIDTLLKVEALYAGATTTGEKIAAGAAAERIKQKINEYIVNDPPREMKCHFSNMWSKRLFCALAKRYGLQPYRYYRQRYTTVMIHVSSKFLNDVLWKEFIELDSVLEKYIDEITTTVIAESIFEGSADEEVISQPLIDSEVPATQQPIIAAKPATNINPNPISTQTPPPPPIQKNTPQHADSPAYNPINLQTNLFRQTPRNAPCPCGSGKKFKKCCGKI
ncbi:MAG: SEC-C domain-containing protein [Planctomycetaceae bacterium]|jgi:hypothetical protein|nr:SEC-C domain-containing protein [Planctomycetaceae bacterium]